MLELIFSWRCRHNDRSLSSASCVRLNLLRLENSSLKFAARSKFCSNSNTLPPQGVLHLSIFGESVKSAW
jgi:hypothetical protein